MTLQPPEEQPASAPESADLYSLVIYQNEEYVSALLQQLFHIGLPMEELRDTINENLREQATEGNVGATFGADIKIPLLPVSAKAGGSGDMKIGSKDDTRNENKTSLQSKYTQANYLYDVRQKLRDHELVTRMTDLDSVRRLKPGNFVEFSSSFEPNEINSILDLATPELVSVIAKYLHKKTALKNFSFTSGSHEDRQNYLAKVEQEAVSRADIAVATVNALRQDFRNETTSEYFGKIIDPETKQPITAVAICDTEYFAGQDRDRILDGSFTVLGKVSEISYGRQSILSRNKVLNRIKQPALSQFQETLKAAGKSGQFDTNFKLNLRPPIVRVIPIAIFI